MKEYGIYAENDFETILEVCDTEDEAKVIVENLNAADPFALPFEKCRYSFREI
jgi:hypothetical protein